LANATAPSSEPFLRKACGTFGRVLGQAGHLFEPRLRAGCYHQVVVVQIAVILGDQDAVLGRLDHLDRGHDHFHAGRDEVTTRLDDIIAGIDAERDEQVARLVVVDLRLIDDRDLPLSGVELATEFVNNHRAGCAGAQHQQPFHTLSL
jgi:hypothetical protein